MNLYAFLWIASTVLAASPVLAEVREAGADDFRITRFGPADDTFAFAARQDMVYNSARDEFFLVFLGRQPVAPVADDEIEMYGLRLSAAGVPLGSPELLSSVDGLGASGGVPQNRRVDYDPGRDGYVVVYEAQDTEFSAASIDLYGRLISGAGAPAGPVFVIDDNTTLDARPDLAINTQDGEFLVVWERDTGTPAQRTIQARLFDASSGQPQGASFRVDTIDRFKGNPTVAYNAVDNQYLVAWTNDANAPQIQVLGADGSRELPQEVDYATPGFFTSRSEIVFNPDLNEYLIVFAQSDPAEGVVRESYDMFGRRISAGGTPLGSGKFRISYSAFVDSFLRAGANLDCNPGGQCLEAGRPGVVYDPSEGAYLVVWSGNLRVQNDPDQEVYIRVLPAGEDPAAVPNQTQISNMGSDSTSFIARLPSIGVSSEGVLATWWGDDNANGGIDDKFEIWGQQITLLVFANGFENGD
ncbi:MAG: hypothetical protein AAGA23_20455 [Pseudomonadota bacterium]